MPTLEYPTRILELPKELKSGHFARFHALARLPDNALLLNTGVWLFEVGGPHFCSLGALAWPDASKTALRTLHTWRAWAPQLEARSRAVGPSARAVAGLHWPAAWDMALIAHHLAAAAG